MASVWLQYGFFRRFGFATRLLFCVIWQQSAFSRLLQFGFSFASTLLQFGLSFASTLLQFCFILDSFAAMRFLSSSPDG